MKMMSVGRTAVKIMSVGRTAVKMMSLLCQGGYMSCGQLSGEQFSVEQQSTVKCPLLC